MDNYFDLHFHPLAKNHLANTREKSSDDCDKSALTQAITMSKPFKDHTDEAVLRTVESQSCIDYLSAGKVRLGIAAIAALEFGVASSKGFLANILNSHLKKPLDENYFDAVKEGKVSYLHLFLREVEQYLTLKESKIIEVLHRGNIHRFNENSLKLTFAIEGGHNLSMKKIGNALQFDDSKNLESSIFDPKSVASKDPATVLEKLVNTFRENDLDILYLTLTRLTHIPEQHLATHAFSVKSLKHPSFYPFGNGISELGFEVIDKAYTLGDMDKHAVDKNAADKDAADKGAADNNAADKDAADNGVADKNKDKAAGPVLIDISHMSLKSRLDLYQYRKDKGYGHIPLIASHVGVTGYSINDWKYNLERNKCVNHVDQGIKTVKIHTRPKVAGYWGSNVKKEFMFNPNTINLMDEDIVEVVHSKGIIGVSLDVRILGYESGGTSEIDTSHIDTSEFMTTADFMTHFPYTGLQSLEYADTGEIRSAEAWSTPVEKEMHPLSFCFNIVHLLAVIGLKANKERPQDFICVGSDFDGFIEPLRVCCDSRRMKDLESNLLKWLPVAAKRYQKENGGTDDLFQFAKKKEALKKVVKAILYENGRDFLAKEFAFERGDTKKPEPVL